MNELHILIRYISLSDLRELLDQINNNIHYVDKDVSSVVVTLSTDEGYVWAISKEELEARKHELIGEE